MDGTARFPVVPPCPISIGYQKFPLFQNAAVKQVVTEARSLGQQKGSPLYIPGPASRVGNVAMQPQGVLTSGMAQRRG